MNVCDILKWYWCIELIWKEIIQYEKRVEKNDSFQGRRVWIQSVKVFIYSRIKQLNEIKTKLNNYWLFFWMRG